MGAAGIAGRNAAVLARGRARDEALMTLTVRALTRSPAGTIAPGDLRAADRYQVHGDPCPARVDGPPQPNDSQAAVGNAETTRVPAELHLPIAAFITADGLEIKPGWRFEVTAVGAADDPALMGRVYEVVAVQPKSHATARRLDVVEV